MTTLLILPAAAYLYFGKYKFTKASFKRIGLLLLVFFPVLIIIYSYLPLRALQNPVINWGNPINMESILRHISGKQYQVWLFSSMDAAKKQLAYFVNKLPSEFAIIGLLISVIGLFVCAVRVKKFFIFVLLIFISTVLYSINYDIVDIDTYFISAYVASSFFAVYGIVKIFEYLKHLTNSHLVPASVIFILLIVQLYINFGKVSQSGVYTFEDYTKALLNSTEKNSIVLSYQWDYFISASYYYQKVELFRKDAAIIDKELLRRSWYFNQLETNYPNVIRKIKPEINLFLQALLPFERDENFDPNLLERLYRNLMSSLISKNFDKHPVYIAPELFENEIQKGELPIPQGYYLVPDLFLFKVVNTKDYIPAGDPNFTIRFPRKRNYYLNFIENMVGSMLVRRALYEMQFDKVDKAKMYMNKVKKDFPNYEIPYELRDVLK